MKQFRLAAATLIGTCTVALIGCGGGGSTMAKPTSSSSTPVSCKASLAAMPAISFASSHGSIGMHTPTRASEGVAVGRLAVRFENAQPSQEATAALARLGARQISDVNPQGTATFAIPDAMDPRRAAASLRGVRGITVSGPVVYRSTLGVVPNDPAFSSGAVNEGTVNTNQWDLFALQMPNAWALTTGSPSIRVAIIDTGYDTANPDLTGKVDAVAVFDLGTGKQNPNCAVLDKDGHGSDVSGIVAADTNNGIDVASVGWNVHLLEARVFPYGKNPSASTEDIAAAINWAVANGANVINLSLGSGTPDPTFEEPAVAAAIAHGVIVVAAAGNDGINAIDYPAKDPGVVAVGASAYKDVVKNVLSGGHEYVASYSNYGSGLSLVAPGGDPSAAQTKCTTQVCIDYLQWIENLDSLSGQFTEPVGLFAGTSQAAPHVSGAVALMLTKDPSLTPAQALAILKSSADSIGSTHQGAGRLNVQNAVNQTP